MTDATEPFRVFVVEPSGTVTQHSKHTFIRHMGISDQVQAAVDLLVDDNYPVEEAAKMMIAAESDGRDPEAFARHMIKLRKGLRDSEDWWRRRKGDRHG